MLWSASALRSSAVDFCPDHMTTLNMIGNALLTPHSPESTVNVINNLTNLLPKIEQTALALGIEEESQLIMRTRLLQRSLPESGELVIDHDKKQFMRELAKRLTIITDDVANLCQIANEVMAPLVKKHDAMATAAIISAQRTHSK